jgi:hypothetical protein
VLGKGKEIEKEIKDASELPFILQEIKNTPFGHIVVYAKYREK